MKTPVWFEVDSALGRWRGVVTERGLARLDLVSRHPAVPEGAARDDRHAAAKELRAYFEGRRRDFTVPVDLSGLPPFRRRVLETLRRSVPFGATTTYGELARRAGRPNAARAVGGAMGANPVPIVVPCHRVLASDGRLGGYGFGLPAKRALLGLEGVSAS